MTGRHGPPEERFWRFVSPEPNGGCWLWTGGLFPTGYGIFGLDSVKRGKRAHQFAWEMTGRAVPAGLELRHTCDVRSCVNPDHLCLGTRRQNMQDAVSRGRTSRGAARPTAKLTDADVAAIRASNLSSMKLATIYPVSDSMVRRIKRNQAWRHL